MKLTAEAIGGLVKGMDGLDVLRTAAALRTRNLFVSRNNQVVRDDGWIYKDYVDAADSVGCIAGEIEDACKRGIEVGGFFWAVDGTLV